MPSWHASEVKRAGHRNESDFASLIGGRVNRGSHTDKKDVIDAQDRSHSVKAGQWWQIFLYGRERWIKNTMFQGIGEISNIMVACIDAYPENYQEYLADKRAAKLRLQPHMRKLLNEMQNPRIFNAFLEKSLFDGGNADYLSAHFGPAKQDVAKKVFHVFHKTDVITALANDIVLRNSKARTPYQTDAQKVIFDSKILGKSIGEIEDRHDSAGHYRQMKFRVHAKSVETILKYHTQACKMITEQVTVHGNAVKLFRIPKGLH